MEFTAEPLAEDALLLRFGDHPDAATNAEVQAAAAALRRTNIGGITELAPAYATLLLRFDPLTATSPADNAEPPHLRMLKFVHSILDDLCSAPATRSGIEPHSMEIPVCYGGDCGQDLAELAAHTRLTPPEVIARHTAQEYTVAMLGFAPGFAYLFGLDPALAMPRRGTPRTRVPAGSVAIGGVQTGIYPRELPGGWNLIGRTPLALFDPRRPKPSLLAPGDRVRFRAISAAEFETRPPSST